MSTPLQSNGEKSEHVDEDMKEDEEYDEEGEEEIDDDEIEKEARLI